MMGMRRSVVRVFGVFGGHITSFLVDLSICFRGIADKIISARGQPIQGPGDAGCRGGGFPLGAGFPLGTSR